MASGKHRKPKDSSSTRTAAVAVLGASVVSPVVLAAPASAAPVSAWDRIAECESGGRWNLPYGDASSTGGLQIQQPTWNDYGGQALASQPYQATKAQQIQIAEKILAGQGPSAWTCNAKTGYPLSSSGPNASHLKGGIDPNAGAPTAPSAPAPKPAAPSEPADAEDGVYVVKGGDTLYEIATNLNTDGGWQRLYEINKGVVGPDPNVLRPGQKLRLPGHEAPEPKAGPVTVMGGDTLYGISAKLGGGFGKDNWKPLYAENLKVIGSNPDLIYPGQLLNVPESWSGKHDKPAGDAHSHKPNDGAQAAPSRPAAPPPVSTLTGSHVMPCVGRIGDGLIVGGGGSMSRSNGGHSGLDISCPNGAVVRSAAAGTVVGTNGAGAAYGLHVVVRHAGGAYTLYAHLSAINVNVGQSVAAGQQVGRVGSTGHSSGAHLHFEVRNHPTAFTSSTFLNPLAWLRSHGVTV